MILNIVKNIYKGWNIIMGIENLSVEVKNVIDQFIKEERNIVVAGEAGAGKVALMESLLEGNDEYELFDKIEDSKKANLVFSKMKLEKNTIAVLDGDSPETVMGNFYNLITEEEELEFNEFKRVVEVIVYVALNDEEQQLVSVFSNQK